MRKDWKWILGGVTGVSVLAAFAVLNLQDALEGAAAPFMNCHGGNPMACYLAMPRATQIGILVQAFFITGGIALAVVLVHRFWRSLTGKPSEDDSHQRTEKTDVDAKDETRVMRVDGSVIVYVSKGATVNVVEDPETATSDRDPPEYPHRRDRMMH